MIKYKIDDLPLKTGHAARGMGVYTKNLISSVASLVKQSEDYELIHYPYFDLFFNSLKVDKTKKNIVTVPDVIPLLYPKHYPLGIKAKVNLFLQKQQLKKADAIITISETSKKDIVRLLDIDPNKIYVTYLAPNFKFKKVRTSAQEMSLPKQFVLYVGDVNYNKNLLTLVKACKKAKTKLVIVGKQATSTDYDANHVENKALKELQEKFGKDKDIIRLGFLSDVDLNKVWNLATIYCQPSFYEGFGLGPLEAMQAGVPVIASRTQALVEILGENCLYFDPINVNDLTGKINLLIKNKKLRDELVKKGKSQAAKYSWEKMAREVVSIYKKVLQ